MLSNDYKDYKVVINKNLETLESTDKKNTRRLSTTQIFSEPKLRPIPILVHFIELVSVLFLSYVYIEKYHMYMYLSKHLLLKNVSLDFTTKG